MVHRAIYETRLFFKLLLTLTTSLVLSIIIIGFVLDTTA